MYYRYYILFYNYCIAIEPPSDTLHREAYYKAIKDKISVKIKMARLVHAGIPRSGKSSTIKRLMGEIINLLDEEKKGNISPSTGVAEYAGQVIIKRSDMRNISSDMTTVSSSDSASSEWSKLKGFIKEDKMLSQLLSQLPQSEFLETKEPAPSLIRQRTVAVEQEEIEKLFPPPQDIRASKDLEEIQIQLKDLNRLILLINTDTGGQPEFLDMLSALIMGPSLYLLYHRLVDPLDRPFKISFTYPDGECTDEDESTITVEEILFQILASITCFSNPKPEGTNESTPEKRPTESISEKYPIRSRALFVGTHLDGIKNKELSEKQKSLQERVKNTSFDKDILLSARKDEPILTVDNYEGDDNDRKETQKVLEEVIRENFKEIKIPASWLILNLYLRKDIPRKRIMSLDECEKQAIKLGIDSTELQSALWFLHHCMGLVLYYPEVKEIKNKVFCDVQVIFDSISQLIVHTFTNTRKVCPGITEKFKKKGIFSSEDLHHAMQPSSDESNQLPVDELVILLEHLKILTVISDSTNKTYFMPCILKSADANQLKDALQAIEAFEENPAPLMLQYNYGFVPVGIFSHMIADIASHWELSKDRMWKNMIEFFVKENKVILVSCPTHITIALSRNDHSVTPNEQLCSAIVEKIKSSLEKVTELMPYKSNAQYKFGFECKHVTSLFSRVINFLLYFFVSPPPPVKDHLCLREEEDDFMRCQLDQHVVYLEPSQSVWFSKVSHIKFYDIATFYGSYYDATEISACTDVSTTTLVLLPVETAQYSRYAYNWLFLRAEEHSPPSLMYIIIIMVVHMFTSVHADSM